MGLVTKQQLEYYFEQYRKTSVTFTKDVRRVLGVVSNQIFLKLKDHVKPCMIYSSNMLTSKIILSLTADELGLMKETNNRVSLRFAFKDIDTSNDITFFVQCIVIKMEIYNKEKGLFSLTLSFTQHPPNDLVEILGRLIDVRLNAEQRGEERIKLDDAVIRKIGMLGNNVEAVLDHKSYKMILRDISFNGMQAILISENMIPISPRVEIAIPLRSGKVVTVYGTIMRFEEVAERQDLMIVAIKLEEGNIPLEYKMLVNNYY